MRTNVRAICFLVSVLLLAALCSTASAARIIYVDDDAAGLNDGASWANARRFLQEALNDARLAEKPVEIHVAQGIYRPNGGLVAIPEFDWRTTTFQLISGVTVKGGYAGLDAPDPNARDIEQYEAILSGDLNGDDGPDFANNAENSYHVVTGSGTDETAVLDGFTITAGNADLSNLGLDPDDSDDSRNYGGGLYNDSGSPVLMDCTFRANSASWNGGGVYNEYASNPILTNCVFTGNAANRGGAMSNNWGNPKVTNCTFTSNRPSTSGGGVIASSDASPILTNCILWNNALPQIAGDAVVTYSDVQGGWEGEGNIDADPVFADPNNGDFHLKSQAGRWNPVSESWIVDDVASPCIDTGDPNSPVAFEPSPNGGIINMGAYGGTAQASKSPSGLSTKYGGGVGEPNDPYLIYTPEQMNTIGLHTEDYDSYFKLMADIDLGGLGPQSFNMIGASPFYFRGVFDGNGHTISNFTYTSTDIVDVGIFSVVFDPHAEIRDLGLINPIIDVESGIPYPEDRNQEKVELNSASSLVNFLGSGTIRRCYVQGGDISADLNVGGLIAYNHGGTIADCSSTATVDGINGIGGLIGYNRGVVTGCHATSTVAGNDGVGGLVGSNEGAIQNSSAVGDVTGDSGVGGLVGENRSHKTIQGSFSAGSVVGSRDVGGLVGFGRGDVIDCYSTCSVSGGQYVGGLVGYLDSATIDSCYSTGHIIYEPIEDLDRDPSIGGLVGFGLTPHENASFPPFEVLRSFWDVETSGQTISSGGTGLTTAEMQTAGTFLEAGWDFVDETANGTDDLWWIAEGQGYPRLWWELGN